MKHYLLNHQPQKGLQAACAQQGQAPTCNARGKGHTSASPKTLTRILLVLLTMLLLPSAAWGQTTYEGGKGDVQDIPLGDDNNRTGTWGSWVVSWDDGITSVRKNQTGKLAFTAIGSKTGHITLSLTRSKYSSEKICSVILSHTTNEVISIQSFKIGDNEISTNGYTHTTSSLSYNPNSPIEWDEGKEIKITIEINNTSSNEGISDLMILTAEVKTATPYNLTVAGITVTDWNKDNVTGKTWWDDNTHQNLPYVSFTPADGTNPATLTLNGAEINYESGNVIVSTLTTPLKINLIGNSNINSGSHLPFEGATGDLVFNTSGQDPASLVMSSTYDGFSPTSFYTGFNEVSYEGDLYAYLSGDKIVAIEKATSYGLTVAGVPVTSVNCGDILDGENKGKVSFKPMSLGADQTSIPATLTLKGATINGKIEWNSSDNLTIALNGKNTIESEEGGPLFISVTPSCTLNVKADNAESATLKYASYSESNGKIANATDYFSGFICSSVLNNFTVQVDGINYNYYTTAEVYPVSVAGRQVHNISGEPGNKDDILGDGKVIFNGTDKLTLNNAELSGPIASGLSALTIHLIGENTLYDCYIAGNGDNVSPTLTLEKEDANSKLTIWKYSNADYFISGFTSFTSDFSLFGFGSNLSPLSGNFEYTGNALRWNGQDQDNLSVMKAFVLFDGAGTTDNPYLIQTKEDLAKLSTFCGQGLITHGSVYQLSTDINCNGLVFEPIGVGESGINGFTGIFDGNSKTISNLTINTNSAAAGLFAKLGDDIQQQDGIIKNLKLSNCSFIGPDDVGAVVGYFHKGTIKNCEISSCTIQCGDAQSPRVGGIAGQVLSGTNSISGCKVSNTTITASTTYTSGEGTVSVGGIAGYVYSGCEVTECEATSVTINAHHSNGSSNAGGIAGFFEGSNLKDNTVKGTTSISTTDAAANFKAGAIVGEKSTEISTDATMANNIYYYAVTITSGKGTFDENTKSGYIHRGTNSDTDPEGVVMYTKNVIIPILNDAGYVSIDADYYYKVTSDNNNTTYNVAPGAEVLVYVEGAAIEGSYTLDNETKAITLTPKEDSSYGYTFDMPDADVTFTIQKAAWVEMFEEQTYATYYNPNEDMAVPMGMTAYIVTGISEDGTKVTVSPVSYIKAGVAVLVEKGEIGEISETTDFSGSKMAYSDPDTPAKPSATDKWYVIYNNKFVKVTTGTEVSGGKCYLNLNGTSSSGTRSYYDIDGNDGTTGIREVKSEGVKGEKLADSAWHDLQGRKFTTKPTKPGLYILYGKKVVIK